MLALFVLGFFVLPSATILLVAARAAPAEATSHHKPKRQSSKASRS
jgi:hypothetical protein